jgi:hypothetical protein
MIKVLILLIFFGLSNLFALTDETAKGFIQSLINNSSNLENYVLPEELSTDNRLGINYYNTEYKWLISYDIESRVKELLQTKQLTYSLQIEDLGNNYSKLIFFINAHKYQKEFYFYNDKFISPISYYTSKWEIRESDYFKFLISDLDLFHEQSIEQLEGFIKKVFEKLQFTQEEKDKLKNEKIIYIYCKDTKEIKKITGFNTRGLYILASDTVITTFNCHYHELIHLLINYKQKELAIYTHPFLMEGIAVALGGRGGKEPEIITDMGYFLEISGFLSYKDLLSYNEFYQNDASLSYPISGLYVSFLLEKIGVEAFLQLYRKYSSNNPVTISINSEDLPYDKEWQKFINNYTTMTNIQFPEKFTENMIIKKDNIKIGETEDFYYFHAKSSKLLFSENENNKKHSSKQYNILFPEAEYKGDKYLILINKEEINVYNLYTNNLIACYVSAFSPLHISVPNKNGWFSFAVRKSIFNKNLFEMKIRTEL